MTASDPNKPVPRWLAGDWLFRLAAPLYIAAGALLKLFTSRPEQLPFFNLITDPTPAQERLAAALLPAVVIAELTVAAFLAFHRGWSRRLALGVLALFCVVLIAQIAANSTSCGCFGAFHTDPTMMLITSGVGIGLILLLPAAPQGHALRNGRWGAIAGSVLAATVLVAVVTGFSLPERLGWRYPVERMRPEEWVGTPLRETPVWRYLDGSPPNYPEHEQTWILWIRTCPHCHELFSTRYGQPTPERVVAVEKPLGPLGISSIPHAIDCLSCTRLSLRAGRFYVLPATPVVLHIVDGVIKRVEVNDKVYP